MMPPVLLVTETPPAEPAVAALKEHKNAIADMVHGFATNRHHRGVYNGRNRQRRKLTYDIVRCAILLCAMNGIRLGSKGFRSNPTSTPSRMPFVDDEMSVPTAIIIGTQKGGTKALQTYLTDYPDVIFSKRVEPHWFDWHIPPNEDANGRIPDQAKYGYLKAYRKHSFDMELVKAAHDENRTIATIEKTPFYIFDLKAPFRIRSSLPKTKIIALLRDPVERAHSYYKMNKFDLRRNNVTSFEDCIEKDITVLKLAGVLPPNEVINWTERNPMSFELAWSNYVKSYRMHRKSCGTSVGRGIYIAQLMLWWEAYTSDERREQFLILKSEDMRPDKDRNVNLKNITDFIGIAERSVINYGGKIHTTYNSDVISEETKLRLRLLFKPFNDALVEFLGPDWDDPWSWQLES